MKKEESVHVLTGEKVKAFFLDKDGVLVDNSGYPGIIPSDVLLHDDIITGLQLIHSKGYKIFIVSNQPWIAKGRLTVSETEAIFQRVITQLKEHDIVIEKHMYCPHQRADNCKCKKPYTGLIDALIEEYDIDKNESFIVGDMDSDILLGQRAGIKTILVRTGRGKDFENSVHSDFVIDNINAIKEVFYG